ncbi:MAG: pilin [Candidatus Saccharimonadales bacterium]
MKKLLVIACSLFCLVVLMAPAMVSAQTPAEAAADAAAAAKAADAAAAAAAQNNSDATDAADAAAKAATPASSAEKAVCEGIGLTADNNGCQSAAGQRSVGDIIKVVINILSIIVAVAAVIMIMIGGFKYIASGGDSSAVQSAKNTILYAVVGLAVAALAQFIVKFVLTKVI